MSLLLSGAFSHCGEQGLLSSCSAGFALLWLLLGQSADSQAHRLQWLQHVGSVVVAPGLQSTGSVVVAPWHVPSSRTRDQTHVFCTGRQNPYH